MPVIIAPNDRERWLKGPNPRELLKPYPSEEMTMWAVSPKLNSPKNDSPDLLEPIAHHPAEPATDLVDRANEGRPERESRRTRSKLPI
jgi:hypothetical protein